MVGTAHQRKIRIIINVELPWFERGKVKTLGFATLYPTYETYNRKKILCDKSNITLLREAFQDVCRRHPFTLDAFVMLPDHIHCIWTLPEDDCDFSMRWRLVKSYYTRRCPGSHKGIRTASRFKKAEQAVWQRRFWEHQIKDEKDFEDHVDYIHYNPVKHGLADSPGGWPFSSFHQYVEQGLYESDWGVDCKIEINQKVGYE